MNLNLLAQATTQPDVVTTATGFLNALYQVLVALGVILGIIVGVLNRMKLNEHSPKIDTAIGLATEAKNATADTATVVNGMADDVKDHGDDITALKAATTKIQATIAHPTLTVRT